MACVPADGQGLEEAADTTSTLGTSPPRVNDGVNDFYTIEDLDADGNLDVAEDFDGDGFEPIQRRDRAIATSNRGQPATISTSSS